MAAVPRPNGRPPHACGQCKARKVRCDRQSPCAECRLRGWNCMANLKSKPGACAKRSTTKPHTAPRYTASWVNSIAHLEHGRDNIFDFIYGSKVHGTEPKLATQIPRLVQAKRSDTDRTQTPYTPPASSSSASEMDFHVTPDAVSVSSIGGISIPVSDDDNTLYEIFQDLSLYRLAEELARSRTVRLAA